MQNTSTNIEDVVLETGTTIHKAEPHAAKWKKRYDSAYEKIVMDHRCTGATSSHKHRKRILNEITWSIH